MKIKFDYSKSFVEEHEIHNFKTFIENSHNLLHANKGPGSEFTGWMNLPSDYDKDEYERVKTVAERIRNNSEVFVILGIGGSYLGARACIEALSHSFHNILSRDQRTSPEIYYVGNNISTKYLNDLFDVIKDKEISINVISKSGTTTETAIAFRIFKEYMENKYGKEEASKRIYATTDKKRGALKTLADIEGYESFEIPDEVGGRYSIFTPVGLLPISVAGIDTDKLMAGALEGMKEYSNPNMDENQCYQYVALRNILYNKGKEIEILVNYEPALMYLSEWWKQLYGESEGKDGKGIYPGSANFTTDLHSLGQLIQDGKRNIFETTIYIDKVDNEVVLKGNEDNLDGLNFLEGKTLDFVNKKAFEGTMMAHVNGNVPNLVISLDELNAFNFGKLIYFFEKGCAISGYVLGVNPFDQPGVEEYKKNMFKLLGKPGF